MKAPSPLSGFSLFSLLFPPIGLGENPNPLRSLPVPVFAETGRGFLGGMTIVDPFPFKSGFLLHPVNNVDE
jgi:hypothetical protein